MLTRLAPTPSGYIHSGNIYNFLINWLWAKKYNGKVMLRIDDADGERKRKEYVEDIFRVLGWLGLDWDIGPTGPDDFEKNWSQQNRKGLYEKILNELAGKDLLFACNCNRKQVCNCQQKNLPLDTTGTAWKIKISDETNVIVPGKGQGTASVNIETPFVVKKKDGFASYQICSLADDRQYGITHIARGEDLLASTAMQLYIDKQLGKQYLKDCVFWHHALILNNEGSKLSKSTEAMGSSMAGSIKKEILFAAFSKWMGIPCNSEITLEETAWLFNIYLQQQ